MAGRSTRTNTEFEVRGINHLALVCRDMDRTVDFYTNVLGTLTASFWSSRQWTRPLTEADVCHQPATLARNSVASP